MPSSDTKINNCKQQQQNLTLKNSDAHIKKLLILCCVFVCWLYFIKISSSNIINGPDVSTCEDGILHQVLKIFLCFKEIVTENIFMDNKYVWEKYIWCKYIYKRNIWCKYICEKYILPLENFLELNHCEACLLIKPNQLNGIIRKTQDLVLFTVKVQK
jgi:hypothetical protein